MTKIKVLYISISGNTRSFAQKLAEYATTQHEKNAVEPEIELREVSEATIPAKEAGPFVAMVPTYLDGGNGVDNGVKELMTNALGEYIADGGNTSLCIGIIGSGNKNFNRQYCLTAKRYAAAFDAPFIADYELRGTDQDVVRIYDVLKKTFASAAAH
ncbi:MAG: class Ib ribonucleoside-diphosphate reductase assembly flavoprotein NrdI [Schleiferilactobacillus perolens]|jgi:protein involved in ribonucleotide reduction|uniref:Ribonucleotide reduction protein n=1 Tax=Schleiferilactobacillus perolens DSM 12744 TaxID=1423792 RepID=A0A0R1N1Q3_9LACO|nr:class Ib ribonucleoside-diphosphate reductase assembly flavoprotein NrdI [Schleiferilactobacillus perolens]KRL14160.1 ribonucleotide reduction protein [Schleiferilactobacillus perolens DSM 12744]MCI1891166.1 class Ib ribonucleoside-diphosphate reductase assembly flavoprotein NrdI [Schleiferilactobacillus harbinensis]MCI1912486.1 class Ib ribonucleoside-diphosphate reductase assembly flavoprotein NrdI [Schleiferilactobacillus harbinensis]